MTNSTMLPGGQRDERGRSGGGGGFARSVAGSAARGAALIALAVVIGIVLLQVIDDGTTGPIGDGSSVDAGGTTGTTAPAAGSSSTTTTTQATPARPPAEVNVLVLNGSGRAGAATAQKNSLQSQGYQTETPADADRRQGNVVYFKPGYDRECTTVAGLVGGAPTVEPMPDPPPTGSENANCVVILGSERTEDRVLAALRPFTEHPDASVVLVDFDGSLAPIVDDPDAARPLPAARDALGVLVGRVGRVGVISGRPAAFLAAALGIDGVTYFGHYGLERVEGGAVVTDPRIEPFTETMAEVAAAAGRELTGLRVERKGAISVALHWRNAPDRAAEAAAWAGRAALTHGLDLHPGRMVIELRPPVPVDKGTVVEALCDGLAAACFAGDDAGDLPAFLALDRLHAEGRLAHAVRIAVRSNEGPVALAAAADLEVEGPAGLAELLRELGDGLSSAPA